MNYWIGKDNKEYRELKDFPEEAVGFTYKITNTTQGKIYYGQKTLKTTRNTPIAKSTYDRLKAEGEEVSRRKNKKKSKKGAPVWNHRRKVIKESNWKTYKGSNKVLKADIKKGDKYIKEIIDICYSKTELNYRELQLIVCSGCFDEKDDCYNEWISFKIRKEFI